MDSSRNITFTIAIVLAFVHFSSTKVCPIKTTEPTRPTILCKCVAPDKCPVLSKENCNGIIAPPGPPCYCCPQCDPLPSPVPFTTKNHKFPPFRCSYACTEEIMMNCPKVTPGTCKGTYRSAGGTSCDCCDRCVKDEDSN